MPSFNLTPDEVTSFLPLPGHALLKCLPAELKDSPDALIVKPESAASSELERAAVRRGEVVKVSWTKNTNWKQWWSEREYIIPLYIHRATVHYLGRLDEAANQYVVVKILQIVAVETPTDRAV
jgi:hypothetical protein